jgi:hypothetical protein
LQTTAPIFFGDLNEIFIEQLVQRICRLTDGARTMGRKNLTIKFLIEHSDFSAAPGTLDRLSALSDSMHRFLNQIVEARNRFISHIDLEAVRLRAARRGTGCRMASVLARSAGFPRSTVATPRSELTLLSERYWQYVRCWLTAHCAEERQLFHSVMEDQEITLRAMRAADTSHFADAL